MDINVNIQVLEKKHLLQIKEILSYWLIDFQKQYSNQDFSQDVEYYFDFIKASLEMPSRKYFVAEYDNKALGFVGYTTELNPILKPYVKTSRPVWLRCLFVDKDHIRKGIGKSLMNHLVKDVKENNYTEIVYLSGERWKEVGWPFHDNLEGFKVVNTINDHDMQTRIYQGILG